MHNWPRVLLCGLVTGAVWTFLSVTLLALVGSEFLAELPGSRLATPGSSAHLYLFMSNFVAGVWVLWLYAIFRLARGPGFHTAAVAALGWWVIASLQSAKWGVLVSVSLPESLALLAATLPAMVLATAAGAWCFERTGNASALVSN